MSIRPNAAAGVIVSTASRVPGLRSMFGAVLLMAALVGAAPVIAADAAATSHPVATLTTVQPDSGAASVGANGSTAPCSG